MIIPKCVLLNVFCFCFSPKYLANTTPIHLCSLSHRNNPPLPPPVSIRGSFRPNRMRRKCFPLSLCDKIGCRCGRFFYSFFLLLVLVDAQRKFWPILRTQPKFNQTSHYNNNNSTNIAATAFRARFVREKCFASRKKC